MPAVFLAYVEDLALCFCITIITWVLVVLAAESGPWHGIVDGIVLSRCAPNCRPDLSIISMVLAVVIASIMLLTTMRTSGISSRTTRLLRALR